MLLSHDHVNVIAICLFDELQLRHSFEVGGVLPDFVPLEIRVQSQKFKDQIGTSNVHPP